jgi:tetratricopeptide (TPR) repeat protein
MSAKPLLVSTIAVLVLAGGVVASPHRLLAQGGDLRGGARQIVADINAQKSAGKFDVAAQQHAVEQLGHLVLRFIDLSDRNANVGASRAENDALAATYQAIDAPLDDIYTDNSRTLERLSRQVMDEDGDLEALYETKPFKDAQIVASQALYYLNWLNYYGARLYDGAKRKDLLEKAQRGFSEFAVGDRRSDLLIESLLGRGLCHLELGNTEFAVHDLQAVIADPQASPERKAKARLALLDAYVRSGNTSEALRLSDEILAGGARGEENIVRYLRAQLLLAAAKKATGSAAERYRQQALGLMDQLRKAGPAWEERVAALVQTSIDNPEKWAANASGPFAKWELAKMLVQKGDYKGAAPLLEALVASSDEQMRRYQGEAHYMLGLAKFQAGDYEQAAAHLDSALQEDKPAYGADAAYMYFKAMEALAAKQPDAGRAAAYEAAIRDYLQKYPDHRSAYEAHFRLGELLQAQRKFAEALTAYAAVHGDPAFELRARFAMLQCDFELLPADGKNAGGRAQALEKIGAELQAFGQQAADYQKHSPRADGLPLDEMRAKAAVMKAVYLNLQPGVNDQAVAETLAGFEKSYPQQADLLPQVVRLRLQAYQRLGRFADAEAEVKAHGPLLLSSLGTAGIEELAVGFVREGARRKGQEGDAANQAAQQVALRLYEQLTTESEGDAKTTLTLARLYENTGEATKAEQFYKDVLQADANSTAALRGLARLAEARGRPAEALGYWQRFSGAVRPGDAPWYEGKYQVARLTGATGKKKEACDQLEELKPAMPGLSDVELRKQLNELYRQTCG